jgi:hypothetical protein
MILGSPMLDIALGQVSALDTVLALMRQSVRVKSGKEHEAKTAFKPTGWDCEMLPQATMDWVQCDKCQKWRRLPWHV